MSDRLLLLAQRLSYRRRNGYYLVLYGIETVGLDP
jgi:hypothetical protein